MLKRHLRPRTLCPRRKGRALHPVSLGRVLQRDRILPDGRRSHLVEAPEFGSGPSYSTIGGEGNATATSNSANRIQAL